LKTSWDNNADTWIVTGKAGTGEGIRYYRKRMESETLPDNVDTGLFISDEADLFNKLEKFVKDKAKYTVHTIY